MIENDVRPKTGANQSSINPHSATPISPRAIHFSRGFESRLVPVKRRNPCPICEHTDWCSVSEDGALVICMRVAAGAVRESRNKGYVHIIRERARELWPPAIRPVRINNKPLVRAPIERRHAVYTALLESLTLSNRHVNDLSRRGLSDTEVARNLYASLPESSTWILDVCHALAINHDLSNVPGFFRDYDGRWTFTARLPGFFIPVRDVWGRIQACQIRQDAGTRYIWFSSRDRKDGASSGVPVHFARHWRVASTGEAVITEGALKADVIAEAIDACVIAVAGVSSFKEDFGQMIKRELPRLRRVFLAFDSDWRIKAQVERALLRLLNSVERAGLLGAFLDWDDAKGLDDLLSKEGHNYD